MEKRRRLGSAAATNPAGPAAMANRQAAVPPTEAAASGLKFQSRLRGWLTAGLLVPPALALAALLAGASLRPVPPAATGDPLLDAFYADFDRQGALPWESGSLSSQGSAGDAGLVGFELRSMRPSTLLKSLDERLTGDPRYWLLLSVNSGFQPPEAERVKLEARGLGERTWFLEEARRRGAANVPVLIRLLEQYDDRWVAAANLAVNDFPAPLPGASKLETQWPRKRWAAKQQGFAAASADELEPLLKELLQVGAADAAAHYTAARLLTATGQLTRAHAEISRGNACAASSNFTTLCGAELWQIERQPPRLWAVEESALGDYFSRSLPNYILWKETVKQLALDAAARGDRQALNELQRFACRFSRSGGHELLNQLVGLVLYGNIETAVESFSVPPLSAAKHQALARRQGPRHRLRDELKQLNQALDTAYGTAVPGQPSWQNYRDAGLGVLSAGDAAAIRYLRFKQRRLAIGNSYYDQTLSPLWDKLASFDFVTLDFAAPAAPSAGGGD